MPLAFLYTLLIPIVLGNEGPTKIVTDYYVSSSEKDRLAEITEDELVDASLKSMTTKVPQLEYANRCISTRSVALI